MKTTSIPVREGLAVKHVRAQVAYQRGALAVTEAIDLTALPCRGREKWTVTHLPTGRCVGAHWRLDRRHALAVVDALAPMLAWERMTDARFARLSKATLARLRAAALEAAGMGAS